MFKIDDEFGSRGHAWIMMDSFKFVDKLQKLVAPVSEAVIGKIRDNLIKTVPKKAKLAMPSIFPTWEAYLNRLC